MKEGTNTTKITGDKYERKEYKEWNHMFNAERVLKEPIQGSLCPSACFSSENSDQI
jgi:hypothetical protein